ncbi:MAG: hypothetical protein A2622_02935 [Bdellovibrionales bacterium RIFCSPHIGHO2_01_FULL_40_29]|nr:MAG: hypothetical protein A2622_02935 [Bdellovibrionales bacterium RIFCSPHIGHO2_01_FULL_40_29]OFZ34031.1 MAG: hypothetical protein A3D17_03355 [Bdellovibrionales bacterium RIFCSPHIGHO2_02_FULL_40_15]
MQISENVPPPKRYQTKEHAQIEVYGRMGKIYCRLTNLSTTGAFLEIINSKYMPKQGDLIHVSVILRQLNKTHTLDAEIIWCKGLGLGISFVRKEQLFEKLTARTSAPAQ